MADLDLLGGSLPRRPFAIWYTTKGGGVVYAKLQTEGFIAYFISDYVCPDT